MKPTHSAFYLFLLFLCAFYQSRAQESVQELEEKETKKKEGWTFGVLPALSYVSDVGFQYGVIANFYNYGDGKLYPKYLQSIYLEWSRTTKGSGINRLYFDSEYLIPNIRVTADISYLTEQTLQFFGFNGYDAVYNKSWENDSDPEYKSRVFYRQDRKMFRVMATFQGKILRDIQSFRWLAGFAYFGNEMGSVDIDRLNKGRDEDDKLPEEDGLFDKYVDWGVLSPDEATGNKLTYLKAGLVYDTRDFDAFPTKGTWAEAIYSYAPAFMGDGKYEYSKLTLWFRQYVPVSPKKLIFAYRLGFQGTMSGNVPFHMQPHIVPTVMTAATSQGLGGSKTLRGVLRNRVVGNGYVLGNAEFRWKFLNTVVWKQNLYLGLNLFADVGRIVDNIDVITEEEFYELPEDIREGDVYSDYFMTNAEEFHLSGGLGLKIGLNDNFVVSCDYGVATDKRDGNNGIYVSLNWLY